MKEHKKSKKPLICLLLYILAVLYITLFSRPRSLMSIVHLDPLWTYKLWATHGWFYIRQVILNIGMCVPLGWLAASAYFSCASASSEARGGKRRAVLICTLLCFLFSVLIELTQFFSGRGSLDIDDVINNSLGALIGILAYAAAGERLPEIPVAVLLVLLGVAGCFMIRPNKNDYTAQFFFDVEHAELGEQLRFSGRCTSNGARTPPYTLLLRDEAGTEYAVETARNGESYSAKADAGEGKYEILVHFRLFPVIGTETYISGDRVEYVAGEVTEPAHATGILKAYSPEYDTYVYQDGDRIVWYIGCGLEPETEIIYHICTNDGEKLPADRIWFGFDNRGFHPGESSELESVDGYRVFEKEIPVEYPVTSITAGLDFGGGTGWSKSFRITA